MKHVLFITTSTQIIGTDFIQTGYEFSEVADPYLAFINAGITVDFASIAGGKPPEDGFDGNHEASKLFRNSAGFKRLNFSHRLKDVDIQAYDAVFFPGGLGPMVDLVDHILMKKIIREMYENGKIISAVCHGPVAFLNVILSNGKRLLEGRKITCFTQKEEEIKGHHIGRIIPFMLEDAIKNEGAIFSNQSPFENYIVIEGNMITGQNPASARDVAKAVIHQLKE